jgi:flagellin
MGLRINQNIAAMNSYRNLTVTEGQMAKSLEKLSSGFRINRAADDAAGLSISEGLRSQVGGLKVAVRNAQDGVSVVQTAEGALTEVHNILQRMRDLSVQASNSGSQDSAAQTAANTEFQQLNSELNRIGSTTSFGGQKLLDGTYGASQALTGTTAAWANKTVTAAEDVFQLTTTVNGTSQALTVTVAQGVYTSGSSLADATNGAIRNALVAAGGKGNEVSVAYQVNSTGTGGQFRMSGTAAFTTADGSDATNFAETHLTIADATSASTGGGTGTFQVGANNVSAEQIAISISKTDATTLGTGALNLSTTAAAQAAITQLDTAISTVSTTRATLGAYQNRFEHTINNLNVAVENLTASESRIRDTDMAQEMMSFTRAQILSQAGTAMLSQANQAPQGVLQLLR